MIEAWSAGVPVVAAASDGPAGLIAKAKAGCWCRCRDARALAAAIDAARRATRHLRVRLACRRAPRRMRPRSPRRAVRRRAISAFSAGRRTTRSMCGIAGLMTCDGTAPAAAPLRAMAQALAHRGPDGDGHYRAGDVGMVQTPARHHRSRHRRPAAVRARRRRRCRQWRDLQLPRAARRIEPPAPLSPSRPSRIASCRCISIAATGSTSPGSCAACTRSRCTIRRRHGWSWRATRSASSRSTTPRHREPSPSRPSRGADRGRAGRAAARPAGAQRAAADAVHDRPPRRSSPAFTGSCPARRSWSPGPHRRAPPPRGAARGRAAVPIDEEEAIGPARRGAARQRARCISAPTCRSGMFLSGGIDSTAVLVDDGAAGRRGRCGLHDRLRRRRGRRRARRRRAPPRMRSAPSMSRSTFDEADFWRLLPEIARRGRRPGRRLRDPADLKPGAARARRRAQGRSCPARAATSCSAGYGRYRSVMRPWWAGGTHAAGARHARRARRAARRARRLARRHRRRRGAADAARPHARCRSAQAVDCADWLPNDLLIKLDRCLMAHGVEGRTPVSRPAASRRLAFRLPDALKIRHGSANGCCAAGSPAACRGPTASPASAASPCRWRDGSAAAPARSGRWSPRRKAVREIVRTRRGASASSSPPPARSAPAAPPGALLFYALWHRRHIEGLALPPDTQMALQEGT